MLTTVRIFPIPSSSHVMIMTHKAKEGNVQSQPNALHVLPVELLQQPKQTMTATVRSERERPAAVVTAAAAAVPAAARASGFFRD